MSDLHKGSDKTSFEYARGLRKELTPAEEVLWEALRGRRLGGYKFRRQHPIAGYIADFYCHEKKIVIEVDGGIHEEQGQKEYDISRTEILTGVGIKVIRFRNNEVLYELERVLNKILKIIDQ